MQIIPVRPRDIAVAVPHVRLLDARAYDLSEAELRVFALDQTTNSGARWVSRSYRYPFALIAWHDQQVGVDIERIEPCDDAFANSICTPTESEMLLRCVHNRNRFVCSLWSSKEALSKALGDARKYDPRLLDSPICWPQLRAGRWHAASLNLGRDHVGWLCWAVNQHSGQFPKKSQNC